MRAAEEAGLQKEDTVQVEEKAQLFVQGEQVQFWRDGAWIDGKIVEVLQTPKAGALKVEQSDTKKLLIYNPELLIAGHVRKAEASEEEIFSHLSKLYRFNDKTWEEKGLGEAKLLKDTMTGKVRFMMRQETTMKVICNHLVVNAPSYCDLFPGANREPCWVWKAQDFSGNDMKVERFALKFSTSENAQAFKDAFEHAKQVQSGPELAQSPVPMPAQKDTERVDAILGEWVFENNPCHIVVEGSSLMFKQVANGEVNEGVLHKKPGGFEVTLIVKHVDQPDKFVGDARLTLDSEGKRLWSSIKYAGETERRIFCLQRPQAAVVQTFEPHEAVEIYSTSQQKWVNAFVAEIKADGAVCVKYGQNQKVIPRLNCTKEVIRKVVFVQGEHVEIWSSTSKEWVAGKIIEVFNTDTKRNIGTDGTMRNAQILAGTLHVQYSGSGLVKYIPPDARGTIRKASSVVQAIG